MRLGELKIHILNTIKRNDINETYLRDLINQVIRFIDNIANWWFTSFKREFVYNSNVEFNYDLLVDNVKSIKKIYYCMPGKTFYNQRLLLLPSKNIEEATLLFDYVEYGGLIDEIDKYYYYGGVYYIENNVVKTLPPILKIGTIAVEGYKFLPLLNQDSDTNWLSDNEPDIIINGVMEKLCTYYEMYDIAEKYKEMFLTGIKALHERNKMLEFNRVEGDLDEFWRVQEKNST